MHPGILGAGAADGSIVAMRGTSFASPQAARLIAEESAEHNGTDMSERERLGNRGNKVEENKNLSNKAKRARARFRKKKRPDELIDVIGRGRVESQENPRVDRLGNQ